MGHVLAGAKAGAAIGAADPSLNPIDRIDPRVRVLAAMAFAIVTVGLSEMAALLAALTTSLALLGLSRLPVRQTLRRMAAMDGFIIFMLVMLPFTTPGTPMITVWGFPASWEGLWHAVEIALTANAVVLALLTLVGTMEPVTLGHALHRLRCPETLVHLLLFTIRYIDVLRSEYLRLRTAMKLRGFRLRSNWHTYRSIGYLIGMVLVRAIERSERILGAMKCRGFNGRLPLLDGLALGAADAVFAVGGGAILVALVALEVSIGAH